MLDTAPPHDLQATVIAWIEREIGPVRKIWRQGRWRPAWYVDAEKEGEIVELFVRGDRMAHFPPMPLKYEAEVMRVFGEEGVKVPHIYGFIDSVPAFVMSRVPGLPNVGTVQDLGVRQSLLEQLAEQMAKIHAIPPERLLALGAPISDDPREVTLLNYRQTEELYLKSDRLPSPDIEFVRGWVNRNAPPCTEGPAVITVDAGQFIFEGDQLTSMLDFELACVGDRHVDMAALRTRDRFEMIGDLEAFYQLYEKKSGFKLDRARIAFQWVTFALLTPLQIAHYLAHPEDGAQYHQWFGSHAALMDDCLRDIARIDGVTLERYRTPQTPRDRWSLLVGALANVVDALPAADEYETYRRNDLAMGLRMVQEHDALRSALEREYLDDVEALIGRRPGDPWDADVQLEAFVQSAGPELDAAILRLLFRRNERVLQLQRRHNPRRRMGQEIVY